MKQKKFTLQKNPTFTLQQRATENIIKDNSPILSKVGELRLLLRRLENELLTKKTAISDVQDTSKELRIELDAAKQKMALQTDELKEIYYHNKWINAAWFISVPAPSRGISGYLGHKIYRYVLNKTRPCERPLLLQAHSEWTSSQPATLKSRDFSLLLTLPTTGLGHVFLIPVLRVIPHLCWEPILWLRF